MNKFKSIYEQKKLFILLLIVFVLFFTFFFVTKTVFASNSKATSPKLVTSITIERGDTLWSIATSYMSSEYDNVDQYISEIKQSNGLMSDTIHVGEHLIIPYYE
ncbi:cell division suppressor protein YneA [Anaeromicropila herbilytica]|uniref:LysM domain-containing protein n=1 Tax=Anaeromicropila herbilytica TaxID=2785025 RepID=A0A7R7IE49_9FIRM|nr:LysM peptidoglycan-binding domain-containing protein [Anaeromicropila herbilytica]BCN30713.1 hypothetical protein bsdtb5_20080 [Anaeromicropila herbilytica]